MAFYTSFVLFIVMIVMVMLPAPVAHAGPAAAAVASAGCATVVCACYAAAGFVFGTVTAGVGTPPAIIACNAAFGTCMKAAFLATFTPTP